MVESKTTRIRTTLTVHFLMILITLTCVLPFVIVLTASLSDESEIIRTGYSVLPKGFTLTAYRTVFQDPTQLLSSYKITIFITVVGAVLSVFITALAAYPISRRDFVWKKYINFYFYFTMIFSGGAVSGYIWITQGLHLKNNLLVLILPLMVNAWNIFLMRTYMSKIPFELIEAAKIDGADEYLVFFKIIIPMCQVGLATIFVMMALVYWNEWYSCLMYINEDKYMTLQYYLIRVMNNIEAILNNNNTILSNNIDTSILPSETVRMAMCVVSAGPMIFVFSFFQKYFVGGIAVGSVKG